MKPIKFAGSGGGGIALFGPFSRPADIKDAIRSEPEAGGGGGFWLGKLSGRPKFGTDAPGLIESCSDCRGNALSRFARLGAPWLNDGGGGVGADGCSRLLNGKFASGIWGKGGENCCGGGTFAVSRESIAT